MTDCDICGALASNDDVLLYENEHWRATLRVDQEYLGSCVVTAKRHVPSLAELKNDEWLSFAEAARWLEAHVSEAFTPTHYNWQCLMNWGASSGISHVHWHCHPRYDRTVDFAKETFTDQRWPNSYRKVEPKRLSFDKLSHIAACIRGDNTTAAQPNG